MSWNEEFCLRGQSKAEKVRTYPVLVISSYMTPKTTIITIKHLSAESPHKEPPVFHKSHATMHSSCVLAWDFRLRSASGSLCVFSYTSRALFAEHILLGKNHASSQLKVLTLIYQTSLLSTEVRDSGPTFYGVKWGMGGGFLMGRLAQSAYLRSMLHRVKICLVHRVQLCARDIPGWSPILQLTALDSTRTHVSLGHLAVVSRTVSPHHFLRDLCPSVKLSSST